MADLTDKERTPRSGTPHPPVTEPARRHVRRRNYYVKKWLQSRYIIYYIAIMASSGLALFTLVQHYSHQALVLEMRQGHSAVFDTWSILKPQIFRANLIVFFSVAAVAAVTTLTLTWTVHQAAVRLSSNIRAYMKGSSSERWEAIRHPVEFQHLQEVLARALSDCSERASRICLEIDDFRKRTRDMREYREGGVLNDREIGDLCIRFERVKAHFAGLQKGDRHAN